MSKFTPENIQALNDEIKAFLVEVNEQKKRLQEDLKAIKHFSSDIKVCDFGCGFGHTTYCLSSILSATESIGIDSDPFAIHKASLWFDAVKLQKQLSVEEEISDDILTQETDRILEIVRPPEFLVRDVVSGKDLPSEIDLAYCRKLLVNIGVGNYENNVSGIAGCKLAIKNIVKTMTPGGWFVAVEQVQGVDFSHLLEDEGLHYENKTRFQLGGGLPCYRYVYRKPDIPPLKS
jgi:hypothetical protein